jgi:FkbM family methyltransferase
MILLARFFKFIFRFPFFRKYYFGLYTKVFRPRGWFRGKVTTCNYRNELKIRLELDDWIQQQVFFFGVFDARGIRFLEGVLRPGDVFLDIGANIGCYSLAAAAKVGLEGKVIAFEPVAHVFKNLQFNFELNRLNQAKAEKLAIYDREGSVTMHVAGRENLGMSSMLRHDAENGQTEEVITSTLDGYLAENGIEGVDLIKLDIEGAELAALKGMCNTLTNLRPVLIIEIIDTMTPDGEAILELLRELNYKAFTLNEEGIKENFRAYSSREAYYNYLFLPAEKL